MITIPGEPVAKTRPRFGRGRTYNPDAAAEQETAWALKAGWPGPPIEDICALVVTFHVKQGRKVDIDNLLKHLMDAGNGVVWRDDSLIISVSMKILEAPKEQARTELEVLTEQRTMGAT